MRGIAKPSVSDSIVEAVLMARYNQPYSEIQNIPLLKCMFFVRLAEAEDEYTKQKIEKQQKESKQKIGRIKKF